MIEGELNLRWTEKLSNPSNSQIIFIRHGESFYKGIFPDLTEKGIDQIRQTSNQLRNHLSKFDDILVISSPEPRALGSAEVFIQTLNQNVDIRKCKYIGPFKIKDLENFLNYDKQHATNIYGQMWLTDNYLLHDNPLVESRKSLQKRSSRFLYHYSRVLDRISKEKNIKIAMAVFTHFEFGINFLQGIYPASSNFPIETEAALKNAEPVILELDTSEKDVYTVYARGVISKVRYDKETRSFSPRT